MAATNQTLIKEVGERRFREDLFYRIMVAYLELPALRERPGDLGLLTDHLIEAINQESEGQPGVQRKKISAGAKKQVGFYHSFTILRKSWLLLHPSP